MERKRPDTPRFVTTPTIIDRYGRVDDDYALCRTGDVTEDGQEVFAWLPTPPRMTPPRWLTAPRPAPTEKPCKPVPRHDPVSALKLRAKATAQIQDSPRPPIFTTAPFLTKKRALAFTDANNQPQFAKPKVDALWQFVIDELIKETQRRRSTDELAPAQHAHLLEKKMQKKKDYTDENIAAAAHGVVADADATE